MSKGIKQLIRAVCFVLVFAAAFLLVSKVFILKQDGSASSTKQYQELPEDTVDVLFNGASGMGAAITPAVIWKEYGISSYNLSTSAQNALTTYYTLREALLYQTPKVFVLDAGCLLRSGDVDDAYFEPFMRGAFDNMKLSSLKAEAIQDIVGQSEKQSAVSYYLPFFRYHDRWSSLTANDILQSAGKKDSDGGSCGHFFNNSVQKVEPIISVEEMADVSDTDVSGTDAAAADDEEGGSASPEDIERSVKYCEKILALCDEKNIEVILLKNPAQFWSVGSHDAVAGFAQEHGVRFIDLNTAENLERIALDYDMDFYSPSHVNNSGSIKVSREIGRVLAEEYGMGSNAGKTGYERFDALAEEYFGRIGSICE